MPNPKKVAPELRKGNHKNKPVLELVDSNVPDVTEPFLVPDPPAYIGSRPGGVEFWESVWFAGGHGYRPAFDSDLVEVYCSKWLDRRDMIAQIGELEAQIAEMGEFVEGSQGQPVKNPFFAEIRAIRGEIRALEADIARLSDKLGRNPEARIRLGLGASKLRTQLDDFLES